MVRILLAFILCVPLSALALRDDLCRSLGKGLELFSESNCREGNKSEYDLACAQVSFGHKYNHGDVRWSSYQGQGFDNISDFADGLTEEVLMNLAAQNIAESNRCMVNFYDEYLASSGTSVDGVKNTFRAAKPKLEALLPPKGSSLRLSFLKPSSELVNKSRTIDMVKRDSVDGPRVSFDAIIASIPLGNHEEIRNFVAKAMVENYSEEKFFSGYQAEVRELKAKHESSLNSILAYRVNTNRPIYNVKKGDRGALELRQSLIDSGAIENYILSNNLESQFAPGFLCRRQRQEKGCIALTAIEFAGGFALPYAAASIGLRAGVAMASRGLTSWSTARFVGHAVSRGLLFSGYVGQLSLVTDDAIEQCLVRHPQYLESKSRSSCEPQKMVFEAASEASMADCLNTVALGLAPLGIAAYLDDALKGAKLYSADEILKEIPSSQGDIVVTASRVPRPLQIYRDKQYERNVKRFTEKYRRENPDAPEASVRTQARSLAQAKRDRVTELHRQCTSMNPSKANLKAGAMFTRYSMGLAVSNTLLSYTLASWDKVKDLEWAAKLGYEVTQAIMISWMSSKIFTESANTFSTKILEGMKVGFFENVSESLVYQGIFNNKDEALAVLDKVSKSSQYDSEINQLLDYMNRQTEFQRYVDGVGDMSNNFMRVITGREEIASMTAAELQRLDQRALQNPETRERLLDMIEDKLYSSGLDVTSSNEAFDRMVFNTGYDLVNIPVQTAIGVASFYAVCMNIDNPVRALAAFGTIQIVRGNATGFAYYRTRDALINQ